MWHISKLKTHVSIRGSEPPLDWHMPVFTGKCFPSTDKKNIVAGTKYWLKLSVLCDLLEIILCTLGPEASGSSR